MVVWFDNEEKNAKLSLRQSEILAVLKDVELELAKPGAMDGEEMFASRLSDWETS